MTRNGCKCRCTKDFGHSFANVVSGWTVPETDQSSINVYKTRDLQIASVATSTATKSFPMAHKMGLIKIVMPSATVSAVTLFDVNNSNTKYTNGSVTAYGLNYFSTSNSGVIPFKSNRITDFYIAKGGTMPKFVTPYFTNTGSVSWAQNSATAVAGNCVSVTTSNTPLARDVAWQWNCSSSIKTFTVPVSGAKYQLEVWGAQGVKSTGYPGTPGMGGYTTATITLSTNSLYVGVGGQPTTSAAGYNGGGDIVRGGGGAGGGASHIAANSNRGVLSAYASNQTDVLIVAGGGGGADNHSESIPFTYAYGGGTTAGPSARICSESYAKGSFGQGGLQGFTGGSHGSGDPGSGGGGGWLGGDGSIGDNSGAGGTGKVNTDAKISGSSTDLSGETIAGSGAYSFTNPTAYANTSTKENGHTGAGYARITILGNSY